MNQNKGALAPLVFGGEQMGEQLKMLAFDLGASSGRAMLGIYEDGRLSIQEIHRFANEPVSLRGHLYWDILRLFHEIKCGLLKAFNSGHTDISSLAIDTWGVDFGLLDRNGDLLGNPYHYRDGRTDGMMEKVFDLIPKEELYKQTGIQFMKLNSIFQLFAMKEYQAHLLRETKTMLLVPDLLNYFLTGQMVTEYSIASTTQLLDPVTRIWHRDLIDKLGLPKDIFTEIVPPGTVIGKLHPDIIAELGAGENISVVTVGSHDTASAVASVPASSVDFAYISSGTWSLMGVEIDQPIINLESAGLSFTNEGGVANKIRFLKNIMGLWLVQECRRQWQREGEQLSFSQLQELARQAEPFVSLIDPDHESFVAPGDMPTRVQQFCQQTGQKVPKTKGEIIRCITESLAMKYRFTMESLEKILNRELSVIHMVGGGIQDELLCQFTADSTGKKVLTGPIEATSIGNLMVQAMVAGKVASLGEMRDCIARSFPQKEYVPQNTRQWSTEYSRFKELLAF
jgi:rhamnulokinase